jgi:CRP-like cAMP-binding protein
MTRRDAKIDRLARVPMFSACNRKELALIARQGDELVLPEGHTLVAEGDVGHEFYVIVEGKAKVTRKGREIATLGPGDFFGELALLDSQRRNATVVAATSLDVLCVGQREFSVLLSDVPQIGKKLLTGMARRLHELDSRV